MAKLSPELKILIHNLKEQLLEILDEARKAEFLLLDQFGETNETVIALDELAEIAQPSLSSNMLKFLTERITIIQNRILALERSIEEIKLDWSL